MRWRPGVFAHQNRDRILHLHITMGYPVCDIHADAVRFIKKHNPNYSISLAQLGAYVRRWKRESTVQANQETNRRDKDAAGQGNPVEFAKPARPDGIQLGKPLSTEERKSIFGG